MNQNEFFNEGALQDYPDVLDVNQIKEILQIGTSMAYRLLRENKISSRRIGKKTIVSKASVIKFVNEMDKETYI